MKGELHPTTVKITTCEADFRSCAYFLGLPDDSFEWIHLFTGVSTPSRDSNGNTA